MEEKDRPLPYCPDELWEPGSPDEPPGGLRCWHFRYFEILLGTLRYFWVLWGTFRYFGGKVRNSVPFLVFFFTFSTVFYQTVLFETVFWMFGTMPHLPTPLPLLIVIFLKKIEKMEGTAKSHIYGLTAMFLDHN